MKWQLPGTGDPYQYMPKTNKDGSPAARPYTGEISPSARRAMAVQAEWKGATADRAEIGFHVGSIADCADCKETRT